MSGGVARGVVRRLLVALCALALTPSGGFSQTKTTYAYDALGRLTEVRDQDVETGINSRPANYEYDKAGNRTRVSNGAGVVELAATFTASTTDARHAGTSGLVPARRMADLLTRTADTAHVTQVEAGGAWIEADLGPPVTDAPKVVNAIDLAPANLAAWSVGEAQLNGAEVAYSEDRNTWTVLSAVGGTALNAYKTITVQDVVARYWRVRRIGPGAVALGEFRLFSGKPTVGSPTEGGGGLAFTVVSGGSEQFNPFEAIPEGQNPRALVSYTQGARTAVRVDPPQPDLIKFDVSNAGPGQDSFQFTLKDAADVSRTYTVSLTITAPPNQPPGNLPPYLQVDTVRTNPERPVTIYPLLNDGDANGDPIRLIGVTAPGSYGEALTWNAAAGSVTYTPWFNFSGEVIIPYRVADRWGATSEGAIKVIVASNNAPVTVVDNIYARAEIPRSFDPRLNDTDADGDALTIKTVGTPQHGTAAISLGQAIVYTAAAGYNGPDSFTYTVSDGRSAGTVTGTVNVTVQPNTDPVAVDDAVAFASGGAMSFDPRVNDSDFDGDALTVTMTTSPGHGVATVAAGGGGIIYTPQPGYTGADSFTYAIIDGHGGMDTATVSVTVDPFAVEYFIVGGGGGGATGNGGGGGGGVRTGVLILPQGTHPITVGAGGVRGPIGTSNTTVNGVSYSSYTFHSGGDGGTSSIGDLIAVAGGGGGSVETAGRPGASGGGAPGGGHDSSQYPGGAGVPGQGYPGGAGGGGWGAFQIGNAAGGGGGAGGPGQDGTQAHAGDGGPGIVSAFSGVTQSYAAGGGAGRGEEQTGPDAGAAGDTSATAGGGQNVADTDYPLNAASAPANRGGGGGGGGSNRGAESGWSVGESGAGGSGVVMIRYPGPPRPLGGTVTQIPGYTLHTFTSSGAFTVTANRRPTAVNDAISIQPGTSRIFDPRRNDQDPDGDPLYVTAIGGEAHGATGIAPGGQAVIYTPNAGATTDSFTYTIADGQGGFAIGSVSVVIQANGAPSAVDDSLTASAGWPRTFDPLVNDTDPQGDLLVIASVGVAGHGEVRIAPDGRALIYTGAPGYTGADSFSYTVDDGQQGSATATVNVTVQPSVRVFAISPAVDGKSIWNLDIEGSLNLGAAGSWTLTPLSDFLAQTKAWGAGGGSSGGAGAGGGYVGGLTRFAVGQAYRIDVGAPGVTITGGAPGGADGGRTTSFKGGGGGGFTGLRTASGDALLIAGGGGGGGWGGAGGAGGGLTPADGASYSGIAGGHGGWGPLFAGTAGDDPFGGGGGGGFHGGLGGDGASGGQNAGGGGGGGSGHAHPTDVTGAVLTTGAGTAAGNSSDPDRGSAGGAGAAGRLLLVGAANTNAAPTATDDMRTITFGASAVLDPRLNDYDPNGDALTVTAIGAPAHGAAVLSGAMVTYTPAPDYAGADAVSYTIADGRGGTASATISIIVTTPTNTAPQPVSDAVSVRANHTVTFDPRTNDSDVDLNGLVVAAVGTPGHGVATAAADGSSITYTPTAGYAGADSLTYTLSDTHGGGAMATIAITVVANSAPLAVEDSVASVGGGAFDPRINDSDVDGDSLSITAVTQPRYGSVTRAADGASVSYTAQAGYKGKDSFTYTISDGEGGSATGTVTVNGLVEYLVVAGGGGGGFYTYPNYAGSGGAGGLRTGSLTLGDSPTVQITVGAGGGKQAKGQGSSIGTMVTTTGGGAGGSNGSRGGDGGSGGGNGAATSGSVGGAGVPGEGYAGSAFFFGGSGGGAGGPAHDGQGGPGLASTISGTSVIYARGGSGLTPGSGGEATTQQNGGGGQNGIVILRYRTGSMTATGGTITYSGDYTIHTYTSSGVFTDSGNRAPAAADDRTAASMNNTTTFDPRANDSDPNGDALSVVSVTPPAHGAASPLADGTRVSYTPAPGYTGADSFTYTIRDPLGETATATVTVTVSAQASVEYFVVAGGGGGGGGYEAAGGGGGGGGVLQGDLALPAGAHTISVGGGGAAGSTTAGGQGGASSIDALVVAIGGGGGGRYQGGVGSGGSGGGGPPGGSVGAGTAGQGYSGGTGGGAGSGGGGGAGGAGGSAGGGFSGSGGVGIASSFSGVTLDYAAGGGGGSRPDDDPEGQWINSGTPGGPSVGLANRGGGGAGGGFCACSDGRYPFPSAAGGSGVVMVRYPTGTVSASGGTVTTAGGYSLHTFTSSGSLTIGAGNAAPSMVDDARSTTWLAPVLLDPRANDSDPNGDAFTVTRLGVPQHGSAVIGAGGTLVTYTPKPGFVGADAFLYTVTDARGAQASGTITITVSAPPNTAPAAADDAIIVLAGDLRTFDPRVNDADAEFDTLLVVAVGLPAHGAASLVPDGAGVRYQPTAGYLGPDSFSYTISDGRGGTAIATVNLTVTIPVTWSPTDKNANVALSNGNLTMTAGAVDVMARATVARTTGKFYFETTITAATAISNVVGVATSSASLSNGWWVGRDANAYGYGRGGTVYNNAATLATYSDFTTGDIVGVAVDLAANRIWWSKNGVWNGSPAQGAGGLALPPGTYFPASSGTTGAVNTANFGATAFAGVLPRGFASWDASSGPAPNHAPVAVNDTVEVDRNFARLIAPHSNDIDADGDTLTITATSLPTNGTVTIAAGGGSVTYTPYAGYTGADSFTYTVSDGVGGTATATVSLSVAVRPVTWNPADKHANIALSNGNLTAGASASGWKTVRAAGGRLSGKLYFEAMIAGSKMDMGPGLANSAAPLGADMSIGSNGVLIYAYSNIGPFFIINGSGISRWSSGTLNSGDVIQVAVDLDAKRVWAKQVTDSTWNASASANPDTGAGGFDISGLMGAGALFPAASVQGTDGSITGNFGASTFQRAPPRGFGSWDGNVPPTANQVPVATNDMVSVERNVAKLITPQSNDTDGEGDTLTITATSSPAHGTVSIASGGGSVTYAPSAGYVGVDSFTYTVSDGAGGTATATVNLSVAIIPVTWNPADKNAAVVLSNGNLKMSVSGELGATRVTASRSMGKYYFEATVGSSGIASTGIGLAMAAASLANDYYLGRDAHGYGLVYTGSIYNAGAATANYPALALSAGDVISVAADLTTGKLWFGRNGVWIGSPANGTDGQAIPAGTWFAATSTGWGGSVTANFGATAFAATLPRGFAPWNASTAAASNHLPVAVNDNLTVMRDVAKILTPQSNDTDGDNDPLTITAIGTAPAHGMATITGSGATITYTPAAGYTGSDSFTYTVSDGAGGAATATVNLTVTIGG